jgi:hypothetical protein
MVKRNYILTSQAFFVGFLIAHFAVSEVIAQDTGVKVKSCVSADCAKPSNRVRTRGAASCSVQKKFLVSQCVNRCMTQRCDWCGKLDSCNWWCQSEDPYIVNTYRDCMQKFPDAPQPAGPGWSSPDRSLDRHDLGATFVSPDSSTPGGRTTARGVASSKTKATTSSDGVPKLKGTTSTDAVSAPALSGPTGGFGASAPQRIK